MVFGNIWFMVIFAEITENNALQSGTPTPPPVDSENWSILNDNVDTPWDKNDVSWYFLFTNREWNTGFWFVPKR